MDVFQYVLCLIGAAAGVAATVHLFRPSGVTFVVVGYLAALLFLGFGKYGIPFLDPFTKLVSALRDVIETPSTESYAAFLDKAATGELTEEARTTGLSLMLDTPVPKLDEILKAAVAKAKGESVRQDLDVARLRYDATIELGRKLASDPSGVFDLARTAGLRPLLHLPDAELRRLQLDVDKFNAVRKKAPPRWVRPVR